MTPDRAATEVELRQIAAEVLQATAVPGAAIALGRGNEIIAVACGLADVAQSVAMAPAARFTVGCNIKLAVALQVLDLCRRGRLALDARLCDLVRVPDGALGLNGRIRLRDLLGHRGGYRGVEFGGTAATWIYDPARLIAHVGASAPLFSPGAVFSYEQADYALIALAVSSITGEDSAEVARGALDAWFPSNTTVGSDASEHFMTPEGAAARIRAARPPAEIWSCAFWPGAWSMPQVVAGLQSLTSQDSELLEMALADAVRLPAVAGGARAEEISTAYAFGAGRFADGLYGRNASTGGQCSGFRLDPKRRIVLSVAVNAWAPHARDEILRRVVQRLGLGVETPEPAEPVSEVYVLRDFAPKELAGVYAGGSVAGAEVTVDDDGDGFECVVLHQRARLRSRFRRVAGDAFRMEASAPHTTIGIISNPDTAEPALFCNFSAYCKLSDARGRA